MILMILMIQYITNLKKNKNRNKIKSECVKNKCLKELIMDGKQGIYYQCLIPLITLVEKEI